MNTTEQLLIFLFGILSIALFLKAYYEINYKKNAYGLTRFLLFLGAFVWGDVFVLGPFWAIISLISLLLDNSYLFLLFVSLFWTVRSFGETIYWLNEQFAGKNRNPPHTLKFHKIFQGESIWFIYQLTWQCIFVFSIIFSLYFAKLWISNI